MIRLISPLCVPFKGSFSRQAGYSPDLLLHLCTYGISTQHSASHLPWAASASSHNPLLSWLPMWPTRPQLWGSRGYASCQSCVCSLPRCLQRAHTGCTQLQARENQGKVGLHPWLMITPSGQDAMTQTAWRHSKGKKEWEGEWDREENTDGGAGRKDRKSREQRPLNLASMKMLSLGPLQSLGAKW